MGIPDYLKRVIRIKKVAAMLLIVLIAVAAAGCSGTNGGNSQSLELLSVKQTATGKIISIGDSKKDVEKVTGPDEDSVMEFLEDGVERWSYWDAPGLLVDYLDEKVVALRISGKPGFELMNGVTPGMHEDDVKNLYESHPYIEYGIRGGILTAYDKDLQPIEYNDETAPYLVRITFEDGAADIINIQMNF